MSVSENDDWTVEERSLLARLPETASLDAAGEDKLIAMLRRNGLFRLRTRRRRVAFQFAMLATAASFVAGVFVGRVSANSDQRGDRVAPRTAVSSPDSSLVTVTRIITM